MLRNIDLKTYAKLIKKTTATPVDGVVPAGMKRWVTFIQFSPHSNTAIGTSLSRCGLYVASVLACTQVASVLLLANRKALVFLRSSKVSAITGRVLPGGRSSPMRFPDAPSLKAPILSIAAGAYLGLVATNTTVMAFVQYFDE